MVRAEYFNIWVSQPGFRGERIRLCATLSFRENLYGILFKLRHQLCPKSSHFSCLPCPCGLYFASFFCGLCIIAVENSLGTHLWTMVRMLSYSLQPSVGLEFSAWYPKLSWWFPFPVVSWKLFGFLEYFQKGILFSHRYNNLLCFTCYFCVIGMEFSWLNANSNVKFQLLQQV